MNTDFHISIHAPRTGSDANGLTWQTCRINFNPRSPHGERHTLDEDVTYAIDISIHAPRTGNDWLSVSIVAVVSDFNPRSPHGERRARANGILIVLCISIHAPRTGSDRAAAVRAWNNDISIHAPRTGSDGGKPCTTSSFTNFNPRSPHGERLIYVDGNDVENKFQSTLPARGATVRVADRQESKIFQSTLPARGATITDCLSRTTSRFQSTLPARGATTWCSSKLCTAEFQSTLPARGATRRFRPVGSRRQYFNPRSPHGERRWRLFFRIQESDFNPRSPHGERPKGRKCKMSENLFQSTLPARGATPTVRAFS